jgi:hypothetical protein
MTLYLSFAKDAAAAGRTKEYVVHPSLSVPLCGGTLFVFAPLDDLFFCHESRFSAKADGHRFAFVYRWLREDGLRAAPSVPRNPLPPPAADRWPQETLPRWKPQLALREVRVYKNDRAAKGLRRGLRLDLPTATGEPSSLFFEAAPSDRLERWRPLMVAQGRLIGPNVYELPRKLRSYKEYVMIADRDDGWMLLGDPHTDAWALINGASPPFEPNAVFARVQHLVHPDELEGKAAAPTASAETWHEFTLVWILQVAPLGLCGEIRLDYGDRFDGDFSRAVHRAGVPGANGPELIAYSHDHFHHQVSPMHIVQYGTPSDKDGERLRQQYFPSSLPPMLKLLDADPVCAPMTYL